MSAAARGEADLQAGRRQVNVLRDCEGRAVADLARLGDDLLGGAWMTGSRLSEASEPASQSTDIIVGEAAEPA
jgi:hypothetical protein